MNVKYFISRQVINAARILASRPRSKVAQENMEVFRDAWEKQDRILTDAVDDIVTVDDFLAVSENHILEDVNKCCLALQEEDSETLDHIAGDGRSRQGVRQRPLQLCEVWKHCESVNQRGMMIMATA